MAIAVERRAEIRVLNGEKTLREWWSDVRGVLSGTHDHYLSYRLPDGSFGYGIVVGRSYLQGTVTVARDDEKGDRLTFPGRFITFDSAFA